MYNKNGSLKLSGNYEKGEESGHWKYYDKEGNFVREADF
jgi:antitoxin component YwqK of YwqJK toxin-antitoxin module